jgi:hypothetical protein
MSPRRQALAPAGHAPSRRRPPVDPGVPRAPRAKRRTTPDRGRICQPAQMSAAASARHVDGIVSTVKSTASPPADATSNIGPAWMPSPSIFDPDLGVIERKVDGTWQADRHPPPLHGAGQHGE